jgi:hypothetical protein
MRILVPIVELVTALPLLAIETHPQRTEKTLTQDNAAKYLPIGASCPATVSQFP